MKRCPICGDLAAAHFAIGDIPILCCISCDHEFADYTANSTHVADVYGNDYFSSVGPGYRDYLSEAAILRQRGRSYGALIGRYARKAKVLDVGSAAGFIAAGIATQDSSSTASSPMSKWRRTLHDRCSCSSTMTY